jgi:FkbM family methyltransferase
MPSSRVQRASVLLRTSAPWRRLMPHKTVRRRVQGVELYMPWRHPLPDYARQAPAYGQNLVELAAALRTDEPLRMLDVGANIGDSALQVIARTGAEVLCVEGDPYWARYLHRNVDAEARAHVVEALLTPEEGSWGGATPVRERGTTRFVSAEGGSLPAMSVRELRELHPDFAHLRLVKSDTDGYDAMLVPAVAEAWADAGPVLFFEWDPPLLRRTDPGDPDLMWARLRDLGYTDLAIWDNGGDPVGQLPIDEALECSRMLARGYKELGYVFWDVAARRADDAVAAAAFDALVPERLVVPA